ncbi:MAG: ribonuclease P protein component [Pirellulales bacterium]
MTEYRFSKRARLLSGGEFERVFAVRASAADKMLVVYGAENGLERPRLGLAVSRRNGSAARRNRWKRVLREVFRLTQHQLPALDLVCVPRADAAPDFDQLVVSFPVLALGIHEKLQRGQRRPRPGEP